MEQELIEIKRKIVDGEYKIKSKYGNGEKKRRRSSEIWEVAYQIFKIENDQESLLKNHVACSKCYTVFPYDMKNIGTNSIKNHIDKHFDSSQNANNKINNYFTQVDIAMNVEDKQKIKNAAF